jgi:hypothetical protein
MMARIIRDYMEITLRRGLTLSYILLQARERGISSLFDVRLCVYLVHMRLQDDDRNKKSRSFILLLSTLLSRALPQHLKVFLTHTHRRTRIAHTMDTFRII